MTGRALVLGGGLAGIAAAFLLADRGHAVTLLESHGWLGGRAFSFHDRVSDAWLDNGPHVMLGCYAAMRGLLRRIGSEDGFAAAAALTVAYREAGGRASRLRLRRWPVPLAMPFGLFGLPLGFGGRLRALRGLLASLRRPPADWTVQRWMERKGQIGGPDRFFWVPLCRAVMNAEPGEASAMLFLATLREAFSGAAANGAIWVPARPWRELVDVPAQRALAAAGVAVRLGARVAALERAGARVAAVVLGSGERLAVADGDVLVSALPWHALARLLGEPAPAFGRVQGSPIVSAHFQVADGAPPLPDDGPLVALVDGEPFHFVCRTPGGDPRRFAVLSGGGRVFDGMSVDAIERAARAQLARHYPEWGEEVAATVRISKEARATILPAPAALALRPSPGVLAGGPGNLRVCGDWTACGLPSTLEGAVRSAALALREA